MRPAVRSATNSCTGPGKKNLILRKNQRRKDYFFRPEHPRKKRKTEMEKIFSGRLKRSYRPSPNPLKKNRSLREFANS
jgi:hypothetical protein